MTTWQWIGAVLVVWALAAVAMCWAWYRLRRHEPREDDGMDQAERSEFPFASGWDQ